VCFTNVFTYKFTYLLAVLVCLVCGQLVKTCKTVAGSDIINDDERRTSIELLCHVRDYFECRVRELHGSGSMA